MKTEDIILRVLGFLPFAMLHLIRLFHVYIRVMILYCKFGGESIIYNKDRKSIIEVYKLLEEKLK